MIWAIVIAVGLLIANGFFVGAEFALTAARRTAIEEAAKRGGARATAALKSIRELSVMLAGAQLGITMASLGLGYVAEPAVARLIESGLHGLHLPPGVLHSMSFAIALTIVVFLHMVVGEMAPKNIVIAQPEKSALQLAIPFRLYANLFRPAIVGLNRIANVGCRLLGIEPQDEVLTAHTSQEIGRMIEESAREGKLDRVEHELLSGAIGFGERDAADAMISRTSIVAAPVTATPAEIERLVLETGHSRIPVFGQSVDHVLGYVHAKDLLRVSPAERERPLSRRLIRPMLVVPESRKLQSLLFDMKRERRHFALVVDEHGGTAGIVTFENVVEEVVGELQDEYDLEESDIEDLGDGRFVLPGRLRVDEVADHLGLELPEGDYETVAGFLMDRLGRIPRRRDVVEYADWRMKVRSMHRRRVVEVLAEKTTPPTRQATNGDTPG